MVTFETRQTPSNIRSKSLVECHSSIRLNHASPRQAVHHRRTHLDGPGGPRHLGIVAAVIPDAARSTSKQSRHSTTIGIRQIASIGKRVHNVMAKRIAEAYHQSADESLVRQARCERGGATRTAGLSYSVVVLVDAGS